MMNPMMAQIARLMVQPREGMMMPNPQWVGTSPLAKQGEMPPDVLMQLRNEGRSQEAAGLIMSPDRAMSIMRSRPFQTNDQGEVVIDTPEEALELEGMRRLNQGEVVGMPPLEQYNKKIAGAPPLDPGMFPGLEEFLSPGADFTERFTGTPGATFDERYYGE